MLSQHIPPSLLFSQGDGVTRSCGWSLNAVFNRKLTLISLNVNGLRQASKRRALFKDLRSYKADLYLLQETHSTPVDQKIWSAEWGGKTFFSHGRSNSKGVCVLVKRDIDLQVTQVHADTDGRLLIIQISAEGETSTIANIYAPIQTEARDQVSFIASCELALSNLNIQSLFMGGDFNTQLTSSTTQPEGSSISSGAVYRNHIHAIMEDYSLMDIWREKNPKSSRGTFHRGAYSARLDYWLIPQHLQIPSSSIEIVPHPLSDHSILKLEIGQTLDTRGPGHWRFDNTFLGDADYREKMLQHINTVKQEELSDPNLRWEWVKYKIRLFTIEYSSSKKRKQRQEIKELQDRLKLLAELQDLRGSPDTLEEVASIKRQLKEIALLEANKTIFRAKASWTMEGEKPSAYFLGLEKRKSKNMTITALKDERGRILTSNQQILERQKTYFTSIYEVPTGVVDPLENFPLSREDVPHISDLDQIALDRPFTVEELHFALKSLNKGKSPGSDGITPEFYLQFWEVLHPLYMESIIFSLQNGSLTEGQRSGLIKLIPKKDLDRQDIANWRPITLLNVDFKIFSKAISARIQSCISQIVSHDQTGFIRGRYIGSNLFNIQSLMDHVEATDSSAFLLAIDYTKAFDTVRWELIFKALDLFGFGDYITSAIKMMFNGIKTAVCNAGFSSSYFFPSGLAVNTHKSHLPLLGNHRHPPTVFRGIGVTNKIKILGLIFKRNISEEDQYILNFEPQLQSIRKTCKTWINRDMSLKGKVTLIKSLLISLLQYPCACTITPPRVYTEFKKIMVDFLWSGKKTKIAYALLIQNIDYGGLQLPDLEYRVMTSLLTWIRNLWRQPDSA